MWGIRAGWLGAAFLVILGGSGCCHTWGKKPPKEAGEVWDENDPRRRGQGVDQPSHLTPERIKGKII